MAAPKKLEAEVMALAALRDAPLDAAACAKLRAALTARSSALVAAAAGVLAHAERSDFGEPLQAAFERFMTNATQTDKGCLAKLAIARVLYRTAADCDDLWLRAIRHVQLEPVWGGKQDTAIELRAIAGGALVQNDCPHVMFELARLLADAEVMARAGAAQALGVTRHVEAATALLRFKVLSGDPDSRVLAACMASLLACAPASSLPFVAELLEGATPELRDVAAIALGESRLPEAFAPLREASERAVLPAERRTCLLGLSLLRSQPAHDHLLELVASAPEAIAKLAIEALAVFRHDEALRDRALSAAERSASLLAFARHTFSAS